ncbi:hypothetical protein WAI69_11345 [Acinetobacter baumannii]
MQPIRVIYNQAYELLSTKHNTLGQPNLNEPIFSKEELCTRQISQNPYPIRVLPS